MLPELRSGCISKADALQIAGRLTGGKLKPPRREPNETPGGTGIGSIKTGIVLSRTPGGFLYERPKRADIVQT